MFSLALPPAAAHRAGRAIALLLLLAFPRTTHAVPWNIETVDIPGDVGRNTSLKLGPGGILGVAYRDATNSRLKYAWKTGAVWSTEAADATAGRGQWPSLAFTSGGEPRVSHLDGAYGGSTVFYTSKVGGVWSTETAVAQIGDLQPASLALAPGDVPRIAYDYTDNNGSDGRDAYLTQKVGATWTPAGTIQHIPGFSINTGGWLSQAIDAAGDSHASFSSFWQSCECDLGYWYAPVGWEYVTTTVKGVNGTSLAVDASGAPHIAYVEGYLTSGPIKYARKTGATWSFESVDALAINCLWVSIALDTGGQPHVAYYDATAGDLKYASRAPNGVWTVEVIDGGGVVGEYCSLVIDGGNDPHISYYDRTNGNLKHAWRQACVAPPKNMVAWWQFDEVSKLATTAKDAVGGNTLTRVGGATRQLGQLVQNSINLQYATDYLERATPAPGGFLDIGTGDFSIDAWTRNTTPGPYSLQVIFDHRKVAPDPYLGYALFLSEGKVACQLADASGYANYIAAGPVLTDGVWHHVAVTVTRSSATGGRLYADGVLVGTFNPTGQSGSLTNAGVTRVGISADGGGTAFEGDIDEVELFKRALTATEVAAIWQAGAAGKCKEASYLPKPTPICPGATTATTTLTICNYTNASQAYAWSIAGLPPGLGCSLAGPGAFSPSSGTTATLASGQCVNIPIVVTPPLLGAGQTSCYRATVTNTATSATHTVDGSVQGTWSKWCVTWISDVVEIGWGGQQGTARFLVTNLTSTEAAFTYSVLGRSEDGDPDYQALTLNGLPPGTPVRGTLLIPGHATVELDVAIGLADYPAFSPQLVVLQELTDEGFWLDAGTVVVEASLTGPTSVAGGPGAGAVDRLEVLSNGGPSVTLARFRLEQAGEVRIDVLDVRGRIVRRLSEGRRGAGPQLVAWDGTSTDGARVSQGLYVLRVQTANRTLASKILRVQR